MTFIRKRLNEVERRRAEALKYLRAMTDRTQGRERLLLQKLRKILAGDGYKPVNQQEVEAFTLEQAIYQCKSRP